MPTHNSYDVGEAFKKIEEELIASMMRNLKKHQVEEIEEGFEWEQWQALQLQALNDYRIDNHRKFPVRFARINEKIRDSIKEMEKTGQSDAETEILDNVVANRRTKRFAPKNQVEIGAGFFSVNNSKLDALLEATTNDMAKAEYAVLRRVEDRYREVIFNAQVYANTGAGTYAQAVDMATRDFLERGIDCIEYKDGRRVNIKSYAEMAVRTANTRAYLVGQGKKRQEWDIHTIVVPKRGNPCPKCLKYMGKVMIDDVYSGGTAAEGKQSHYPLLSEAMTDGFLHPNCKCGFSTYFPGITGKDVLEKPNEEEIGEAIEQERIEGKKNYLKRQEEGYSRKSRYALDLNNRKENEVKADYIKAQMKILEDPEKVVDLHGDTRYGTPLNKVVSTVDEALEKLEEFNIEVSKEVLDKVDNELIVDIANAVNAIYEQVPAIKPLLESLKIPLKLMPEDADWYDKDGIAAYYKEKLYVREEDWVSKRVLYDIIKGNIKKGYLMPATEEYYTLYPIVHEYGHVLIEALIQKYAMDNGISDISNKVKKEAFAYYLEELKSWIMYVDPSYMNKTVSNYAEDKPIEFFAEAFANLICGKPNSMGRGMKLFLERL